MKLLYDIALKNGQKLEGCYFIKYEQPVYSGRSSNKKIILAYVPSYMSCLIGENEVKDIDFIDAEITKIYEEDTNIDCTDELIEKYKEIATMLGYYPDFPIPRQIIRLE